MIRTHYTRSDSSSPEKSPPRNLPSNHLIEDRFKSYSKVEDYIRHLTNIYHNKISTKQTRDEAYFNTSRFRAQTPSDHSRFKVSQFPKSKVNQELLNQQEVLNAFNHLSLESKSRCSSRQRTRHLAITKRSKTARFDFSYKKEKIVLAEKCQECKKLACSCSKKVNDSFLKNLLRKHCKSLEKARVELSPKKHRQSFSITQSRNAERPEMVVEVKRKIERKVKKRRTHTRLDFEFDRSLMISPVHIEFRERR